MLDESGEEALIVSEQLAFCLNHLCSIESNLDPVFPCTLQITLENSRVRGEPFGKTCKSRDQTKKLRIISIT